MSEFRWNVVSYECFAKNKNGKENVVAKIGLWDGGWNVYRKQAKDASYATLKEAKQAIIKEYGKSVLFVPKSWEMSVPMVAGSGNAGEVYAEISVWRGYSGEENPVYTWLVTCSTLPLEEWQFPDLDTFGRAKNAAESLARGLIAVMECLGWQRRDNDGTK